MGVATTAVGTYDAALQRRQALMGASGARALVKNWKVARIAAFACIGDMGDYIKNQTKKGWLTSILELGAWLGTVMSGAIAELCSRKYGILIATCVFIIGVVIQSTAIQAGHNVILAGRFITLSTIVPLYNSECAPPGCHFIGGTGESQKDAAWQIPICLQLAPALILLVGMAWMPFSPRWLIHHGREEEAREVLANLRDLPTDHELIELEYLEIKAQSLFEKRSLAERFPHLQEDTAMNTVKLQFVAIGALFKSKAMFKRVIVATVTMFFQQWTGINAVLYYAPQIFGQLGLSSNTTSLLATGVVGIVMFIATVPAVLWIDRLGRKPVLTVGAIGMGACHLIIAVILAKNIDQFETHKAAGWAAICMVWLFVVHFGYSWGPCAWIIVAEVWPLSTRPYGTSLGASSNWMNNFIDGMYSSNFTSTAADCSQDIIFGSEGTALADNERMAEINREIGLDNIIYRDQSTHRTEVPEKEML
ncbi:hypothetical protein BFJ68_g10967 [Fusarium oxysporum]|uniref:Major facilitator superfamily (MFS) profile domain-containing protein n=1 Tax=Fusarium oxysporum TaxID=5507 RepID=A0A420QIJ1_FUSOX|nr:hypothetical protein BFJ68_g10967 [Fusarium oxysporum]